MKETYLGKYEKSHPKILPYLNSKKIKNNSSFFHNLRNPTQQSLINEIKDIDQSLNTKKFHYRNGILFSFEINDRLVDALHDCTKNKVAILQSGFMLLNSDSRDHHQDQRLTEKIETFSQNLKNKSLQKVHEFDLNKYRQLIKINKNHWSLFKRVNQKGQKTEVSQNLKYFKNMKKSFPPIEEEEPNKQTKTSKNLTNLTLAHSYMTKNNTSNSSKAQHRSPESELSKIIQYKNDSRVLQSRQVPYSHRKSNRKILTEISQISNPETYQIPATKYDIRNMLKKEDGKLIYIWLPPATYPQFFGMFRYYQTKKETICRLKKYFFFKRGLNKKFFNSILEEIALSEGKIIQQLELSTSKNEFTKVFEPLGFRIKSIQCLDHIRIRFRKEDY